MNCQGWIIRERFTIEIALSDLLNKRIKISLILLCGRRKE